MWPFTSKEVVVKEEGETPSLPEVPLIKDYSSLLTLVEFEKPKGLVVGYVDEEGCSVKLKLELSLEFSKDLVTHFELSSGDNKDLIYKNFGGSLVHCITSLLENLPIISEEQYLKFYPPNKVARDVSFIYMFQQDEVFWLEVNYKICDKY